MRRTNTPGPGRLPALRRWCSLAAWSPPPVLVRGAHLLYPARVESVVPATVERAAAATNQAFDQLKVRQVKSQVEQGRMGRSGKSKARPAIARSASRSRQKAPMRPACRW